MTGIRRLRIPRLELFSGSLPGRVLWFTAGIVFAVELLVLILNLGEIRLTWLQDRAAQAGLSAYALSLKQPDLAVARTMLSAAGVHRVTLERPGQAPFILTLADVPPPHGKPLALDSESLSGSIWLACRRLAGFGHPEIAFSFPAPGTLGSRVEVQMDASPLEAMLKQQLLHGLSLAAACALLTGLLVFIVLERLLVRPLRLITTSMRGFREDPEHADETGLAWLAARPEGDISSAARELKATQEALRAALWRNARLAAVGIAVAKIAHDLRNILSSALLVADRLDGVTDESTRRAALTLIRAVEQAAGLVTRTVDFTREGPPPLTRASVQPASLAEEAALSAWPDGAGPEVENEIPPALTLALDKAQFQRVLVNLLRNAAEAGASRIRLSAETGNGTARLLIADNGPGLPQRARDNLFKPFSGGARTSGTGLGLAIASDLVRAHGGELALERTGPEGTSFRIDLPISQ